jgi:hypothetical protein
VSRWICSEEEDEPSEGREGVSSCCSISRLPLRNTLYRPRKLFLLLSEKDGRKRLSYLSLYSFSSEAATDHRQQRSSLA